MIQVRNKNLETERQALDIDRELEYGGWPRSASSRCSARPSGPTWPASAPRRSRRPSGPDSGPREAVGPRAQSPRSGRWRRSGSARSARWSQLEIGRRQAVDLAEQQRGHRGGRAVESASEAQGAADLARARARQERVSRPDRDGRRRKLIDLTRPAGAARPRRARPACGAREGGRSAISVARTAGRGPGPDRPPPGPPNLRLRLLGPPRWPVLLGSSTACRRPIRAAPPRAPCRSAPPPPPLGGDARAVTALRTPICLPRHPAPFSARGRARRPAGTRAASELADMASAPYSSSAGRCRAAWRSVSRFLFAHLDHGVLLDVVADLLAPLDLLGEPGETLRVEGVGRVEELHRGLVERVSETASSSSPFCRGRPPPRPSPA